MKDVEAKISRWMVGDTTEDDGWQILTEDEVIFDEEDGNAREWVATVYDEETAKLIVEEHNATLNK
jgi:hypothetical protein